jgi:alpha-N-arabinofuranosidase
MKSRISSLFLLLSLALSGLLPAAELHVATSGDDSHSGAKDAPLRTIQRAADLAQPGDTITVHTGFYRERITPPGGGESLTKQGEDFIATAAG